MNSDTCIIKGCANHRGKRGLCIAHYSAARRMIERGAIDWAGLESRGLALPGKRGRPSKFAALVDGTAGGLSATRSLTPRGRHTKTPT